MQDGGHEARHFAIRRRSLQEVRIHEALDDGLLLRWIPIKRVQQVDDGIVEAPGQLLLRWHPGSGLFGPDVFEPVGDLLLVHGHAGAAR